MVGLALLGAGRFVQFDQATDYNSFQWNLPLGGLAAIAAAAAIGVASANATARLWLGAILGLLDVFLIWQSITNVNFRFVWEGDEGPMMMFEIGLGLLALVLIATGLQPAKDRGRAPEQRVGAGRWFVRAAVYLSATVLFAFVATFQGIEYYTPADCDECLDGLKGLYWGIAALGISLVVVVVIELVLLNQRRNRRRDSVSA